MKRYGKTEEIVMDKLNSYRAIIKAVGNAGLQETGR